MEKIPVEVLEDICNVFDDRVTLKALRLVNKNFADIAASFIFKTLVVFQHLSSWRRVQLIAHRPRLAHLVRKLEIVTLAIGGKTPTFTEWKQRTQGRRVEGRLRLGNRRAAVAEVVETLDDKLGVVLRLQQRYQTWLRWNEGQETIERIAVCFESHGSPISLRLPALGEIETVWPPEIWIPAPDPGRRRRGYSRLGLADLFGPTNKRCTAHLSFALLVLHDSELKVTTLELHQHREILLDQMYSVPILVYLKHLKLHFRQHFTIEHDQAMAMSDGKGYYEWILAPYLAKARNLESLILKEDLFRDSYIDAAVWFDIIPKFSTASWPKLRSVWFAERFTDSGDLVQFLMKHGNSLRSIHLDRPVRHKIRWQLLAFNIRARYANTNCVISSSDDTIFRSESDCIKESDLSSNDNWRGSTKDIDAWWARW